MAKKQWPPTLRNPWGGHKSAGLVGAPESSDAPPAKGRRGRASRAGADERRDQSGLGPQGRTAVKRAVHEMDPSGKRGRGKAPDMWRGMIAPIIENPHARHGKPELTFQQQEYKTPHKGRAAAKPDQPQRQAPKAPKAPPTTGPGPMPPLIRVAGLNRKTPLHIFDPYELQLDYGRDQLRNLLGRATIHNVRVAVREVQKRHPGTQPQRKDRPGMIDYVVEHVHADRPNDP